MAKLDFENFKHLQNPGHLPLTEDIMYLLHHVLDITKAIIFKICMVLAKETPSENKSKIVTFPNVKSGQI